MGREVRAPRGNPRRQRENMQTPLRKGFEPMTFLLWGHCVVCLRDMSSGCSDHYGPDSSAGASSCISHLSLPSSFYHLYVVNFICLYVVHIYEQEQCCSYVHDIQTFDFMALSGTLLMTSDNTDPVYIDRPHSLYLKLILTEYVYFFCTHLFHPWASQTNQLHMWSLRVD